MQYMRIGFLPHQRSGSNFGIKPLKRSKIENVRRERNAEIMTYDGLTLPLFIGRNELRAPAHVSVPAGRVANTPAVIPAVISAKTPSAIPNCFLPLYYKSENARYSISIAPHAKPPSIPPSATLSISSILFGN